MARRPGGGGGSPDDTGTQPGNNRPSNSPSIQSNTTQPVTPGQPAPANARPTATSSETDDPSTPLAPDGGLQRHEDSGGHTLDPSRAHVGATDQQMGRDRPNYAYSGPRK
jgi:hypothetical protein